MVSKMVAHTSAHPTWESAGFTIDSAAVEETRARTLLIGDARIHMLVAPRAT
jgi:hypothetical protein